MNPLTTSQLLGVPLETVLQAFENIKTGRVSWIVVSGKMCSGKDTIAPLIQPALGYTDVERLGFGDTIRVEANQAIEILGGRSDAPEVLEREIAEKLHMKPNHARELVELLHPLVEDPNHGIDASVRSDEMRKILVLFGSDWRTADDSGYWSRQLAAMSLGYLARGTSIYLTGGRFEPDVEIPQSAGAKIIRLDITPETQAERLRGRDGLSVNMDAVNHISETALDNWPHFDVRVNNDGTLEEGLNAVVAALSEKENNK